MAFKTGAGEKNVKKWKKRHINGTTIISLVHYNDYKRQLRGSLKSRKIKGKDPTFTKMRNVRGAECEETRRE